MRRLHHSSFSLSSFLHFVFDAPIDFCNLLAVMGTVAGAGWMLKVSLLRGHFDPDHLFSHAALYASATSVLTGAMVGSVVGVMLAVLLWGIYLHWVYLRYRLSGRVKVWFMRTPLDRLMGLCVRTVCFLFLFSFGIFVYCFLKPTEVTVAVEEPPPVQVSPPLYICTRTSCNRASSVCALCTSSAPEWRCGHRQRRGYGEWQWFSLIVKVPPS